MANTFYSATDAATAKTTFDLADLGVTVSRMIPYGTLDGNGTLRGFNTFEATVVAADYDEAFTKKLLELKPSNRVLDFLNYHFSYFLGEGNDGIEFLHHMEYVILPRATNRPNTAFSSVMEGWLKTQKLLMFSQNKQQRLAFLEAAYKAASEHAPAQPLSVQMDPLELGKRLGLDRPTVSRIVTELVQDGHVSSTLGMGSMSVTREGAKQLEGETESKPSVQHNFHFAQGSTNAIATGSNSVQVTNTGQSAQLNVASGSQVTQSSIGPQISPLLDLVEQLRQVLISEPKLEPHREDIEDELRRIDTQLQRAEPKRSILARSFEALHDLAKDSLGSATGHVVFELLQQVPQLLGSAS